MKIKLSISMDDSTVSLIEEHVRQGRFRNKSHAVEYAVNKLIREADDGVV
jgi:Arc/MetJ-type ribon-helix-helix transcriptional regulator